MAYIPQTGIQPLDRAVVEALARAVGLQLPPEDVDPLAMMLAEQYALIGRLARLDPANAEPEMPFDPRRPGAGSAERGGQQGD